MLNCIHVGRCGSLSQARYDKAIRKKRDKVIEDFVRSEFQFLFNVAEYAKVLIDSWRGTYGNCLCGGGVCEPPIPAFLVKDIRPDTPRKSLDEEYELKEEGSEEDDEEEGEEEEEVEDEGHEGDNLEEGLDEMGEGEEVEVVLTEGGSEEIPKDETVLEEDEDEEEEEKEEGELPQSEDEHCVCIKDYMFPFPPDEYDFPFNIEGHT